MDDEDQAVLKHMSDIAEILNYHCPQDVIDWNAALDAVPYQTPKAKRKAKKEKK